MIRKFKSDKGRIKKGHGIEDNIANGKDKLNVDTFGKAYLYSKKEEETERNKSFYHETNDLKTDDYDWITEHPEYAPNKIFLSSTNDKLNFPKYFENIHNDIIPNENPVFRLCLDAIKINPFEIRSKNFRRILHHHVTQLKKYNKLCPKYKNKNNQLDIEEYDEIEELAKLIYIQIKESEKVNNVETLSEEEIEKLLKSLSLPSKFSVIDSVEGINNNNIDFKKSQKESHDIFEETTKEIALTTELKNNNKTLNISGMEEESQSVKVIEKSEEKNYKLVNLKSNLRPYTSNNKHIYPDKLKLTSGRDISIENMNNLLYNNCRLFQKFDKKPKDKKYLSSFKGKKNKINLVRQKFEPLSTILTPITDYYDKEVYEDSYRNKEYNNFDEYDNDIPFYGFDDDQEYSTTFTTTTDATAGNFRSTSAIEKKTFRENPFKKRDYLYNNYNTNFTFDVKLMTETMTTTDSYYPPVNTLSSKKDYQLMTFDDNKSFNTNSISTITTTTQSHINSKKLSPIIFDIDNQGKINEIYLKSQQLPNRPQSSFISNTDSSFDFEFQDAKAHLQSFKPYLTTKNGNAASRKSLSNLHYIGEFEKFGEYYALIDFYTDCGGDNWIRKDNWCSNKPVNEWFGVGINVEGYVVEINMPNNNVCGTFPDMLGRLKNIEVIMLDNNNFKGLISDHCMAKLYNLMVFSMRNNCLSGKISFNMMDMLVKLREIWLSNNQLSGIIEDGISELKSLTHICLYNNNLHGTIPESICELNNLEYISLGNNNFTGSIPRDIISLYKLNTLSLYNNSFSGEIPQWLETLPSLKVLEIFGNNFNGYVPVSADDLREYRKRL